MLASNLMRALLALAVAVSDCSALHIRKDVDGLVQHRVTRALKAPPVARSSTSTLLIPGTSVNGLVKAYVGSSPSRKRQSDSLGYFSPETTSLEPYDSLYVRCSRAVPGCTPVPFTFTVPDSADELIQIGYEGFEGLILSLVGLYTDHIGWDDQTNGWIDYDMSLGAGNANYLIFSDWGMNTPVGTPPTYVEGAAAGWTETSVFSIDPATGALGVNWVNPDGSYPDVYMVYSQSVNMIYVTGDVDLLATTLGVDDLEPLTLIFSTGELAS
ncbi:hypothetical protein DACRYDRAFT_23161 [Dacryopinax primogenitus]|uniref:Acid protease n=1 Tax=Dacryopinax primogenitus (strain DJM 731) TaxID=1858805 RepID=M5FYD7_DACPD|nr:uncharacterized protein DACRYDRAFT_23161 [Dacryopinax primogenitus]EJU00855.1 hypothetical protein DACRYDRAFT_23161 [Dacryopinax primogenitus]